MTAIPSITEFVQVPLQMFFAKMVERSEQKTLGVCNDQAHAGQFLILQMIRYVTHFDPVPELHNHVMRLPPIATEELTWRLCFDFVCNYWLENTQGCILDHLHY